MNEGAVRGGLSEEEFSRQAEEFLVRFDGRMRHVVTFKQALATMALASIASFYALFAWTDYLSTSLNLVGARAYGKEIARESAKSELRRTDDFYGRVLHVGSRIAAREYLEGQK